MGTEHMGNTNGDSALNKRKIAARWPIILMPILLLFIVVIGINMEPGRCFSSFVFQ